MLFRSQLIAALRIACYLFHKQAGESISRADRVVNVESQRAADQRAAQFVLLRRIK